MKGIHKYILLSLLICLMPLNKCNSQLTVDIGPDTIYCQGVYFDTMYIAPKLNIENGTEPFTYAWDCRTEFGGYLIFWASSYLSDTTASNPFFIDFYTNNKWLTFYLHVWDVNENYAIDSINVKFSSYIYYTLGYDRYLAKGDSFQFFLGSMIGEGIEPVTHCYVPEYGLTDPCSVFTWCKPDTTTYYYEYATDSMGCVSENTLVYRVFVFPASVENSSDDGCNSDIRKIEDKIVFNNPRNKTAIIVIYSLDGSVIFSTRTTQDYLLIADLNISRGVYIITVNIDKIILSTKVQF